jgi:hypothetical protein
MSETVKRGKARAVDLSTASREIVKENPKRKEIKIKNPGATTCYLTTDKQDPTGQGYDLAQNAVYESTENQGAIYGLTASGTTTVKVFEVSE